MAEATDAIWTRDELKDIAVDPSKKHVHELATLFQNAELNAAQIAPLIAELELPPADTFTISAKLLAEIITPYQAYAKIFESWVGRRSTEATFGALFDALERMQWRAPIPKILRAGWKGVVRTEQPRYWLAGEIETESRLQQAVPRASARAPSTSTIPSNLSDAPSSYSFELPIVVSFTSRRLKNKKYDLEELHDLVTKQNNLNASTPILATAVTGLGGIGKSALCIHYATAYFETFYQNVIWLNCETETTMTDSICRLVEKLNFPADKKSLGIPDTLQHLCQRLQVGKTLIIFDNVDDTTKCHVPAAKMAADLSNHHYVLFSSRSQEWNDYTNKLVLTLLSTDESVQFLTSYLTLTTADQTNLATHISTELQNLPLAIRQTGAYIKYKLEPTNTPLAGLTTCLNLLKSEPEKILDYKYDCPTGDTYNKTICTTWGTTMVRIKGIDPLAVRIMKLASYFNSESIPFEIFCQLSPLPARSNRRFWAARFQTSGEKMRGSSVLGRDLVENALNCLTKYSMIGVEKETQTFEIHRLVQKVIRARVDRTQTYDILKEAIRLIGFVLRLKNYEDFEQICLAHAETIWAHFDKRGLAREEFLQEFRELIHIKMDTLDFRGQRNIFR